MTSPSGSAAVTPQMEQTLSQESVLSMSSLATTNVDEDETQRNNSNSPLQDAGSSSRWAWIPQSMESLVPFKKSKTGSSKKSNKRDPVDFFTVTLDNSRTIYLPGQRVEGVVSISFKRPTAVRLLRVRISGHISTQLSKHDVSPTNVLSLMTLFKDVCNLGETGTSENPLMEFPAGESVFPFAFRLPASALPASFDGAYGRIYYEVTAVLLLPPGFSTTTKRVISIPITIPSTVSETTHDLSREVQETGSLSTYSWGLFKNGHIDILAKLPKEGFNSEEIAPLTLEITNHSKEPVAVKGICIKQRVTYKMINEIRGPRTERIHRLNYSELLPSHLRKVTRYIQVPIPSVSLLSPYIDTPILSVNHVIVIKIAAGRRTSKVEIPFTICGFPWHAFEVDGRVSLDTLPAYTPGQSEDGRSQAEESESSSPTREVPELTFEARKSEHNHLNDMTSEENTIIESSSNSIVEGPLRTPSKGLIEDQASA